MSASSSLHVVIVGGGAFGCAIAFRLAQAKVGVTLVERNAIGENASGKNAGNLNPIYLTPPALLPLALASFRLHLTIRKELAQLGCQQYSLESAPRILLSFNEVETAGLNEIGQLFADHRGFSACLLDAVSVNNLDTRVSKSIHAGLLVEGNMCIDSLGLMRALIDGARRLGANFVNASVQGIQAHSQKATNVILDNKTLDCDAVVLATGPWANQTDKWIGLSLPVKPIKGEMLRVRMNGEKLGYDFTHGPISIYRRRDEVWIGTTYEDTGLNSEPTKAAERDLWNGALQIMPRLGDARIVERTAALRPMTSNGLPILQRAPNWENVFVANGGGSKGILLCTGAAQTILELVLG